MRYKAQLEQLELNEISKKKLRPIHLDNQIEQIGIGID